MKDHCLPSHKFFFYKSLIIFIFSFKFCVFFYKIPTYYYQVTQDKQIINLKVKIFKYLSFFERINIYLFKQLLKGLINIYRTLMRIEIHMTRIIIGCVINHTLVPNYRQKQLETRDPLFGQLIVYSVAFLAQYIVVSFSLFFLLARHFFMYSIFLCVLFLYKQFLQFR